MKKKFKRFSYVHVCKDMPDYMYHFPCSFDGIIGDSSLSTIRQDGRRIFEYSVYKLENGKVIDEISWYQEDQLSLLKEQPRNGEELIDEFEQSI
jgi:hypothetical protein